jgi:hypothetical protein
MKRTNRSAQETFLSMRAHAFVERGARRISLKFQGEKEPNISENSARNERLAERDWPPLAERLLMKTLIHFRRHEDRYFHAHPLHTMFSLIASILLAVLVVMMLVGSAR